jgi:hypothetical protein
MKTTTLERTCDHAAEDFAAARLCLFNAIKQQRGLTAALRLVADALAKPDAEASMALTAIAESFEEVARGLDCVEADLEILRRPVSGEG